MPELPEVETTRRGLEPHLVGYHIDKIMVRETRLRWPVSRQVSGLEGQQITRLSRRGKYLLMALDEGCLIWHLGMSGSMKIAPVGSIVAPHEHIEIQMNSGKALKYRDPRRFGALLYTADDPLRHRLLSQLGPEPLGDQFTGDYLYRCCRQRKAPIKTIIMNSHIVVGIGNIYACEALFRAGILPTRSAGRIGRARLSRLVDEIRQTLTVAIGQGGTTLQDFTRVDGTPGYFSQSLMVYGNKGNCLVCGKAIKRITQAQRSSYYCPACQS